MSLKEIVNNSNYVTDEELTDSNILGMANTCFSEVNKKCGTLLPFFKTEDVTAPDTYRAIPETWVLALVEPYFSYSIAANDGDYNARDFHYNRFLGAVEDFKDRGMGSITNDSYKGDSNLRVKAIDVSDVTMNWGGWF